MISNKNETRVFSVINSKKNKPKQSEPQLIKQDASIWTDKLGNLGYSFDEAIAELVNNCFTAKKGCDISVMLNYDPLGDNSSIHIIDNVGIQTDTKIIDNEVISNFHDVLGLGIATNFQEMIKPLAEHHMGLKTGTSHLGTFKSMYTKTKKDNCTYELQLDLSHQDGPKSIVIIHDGDKLNEISNGMLTTHGTVLVIGDLKPTIKDNIKNQNITYVNSQTLIRPLGVRYQDKLINGSIKSLKIYHNDLSKSTNPRPGDVLSIRPILMKQTLRPTLFLKNGLGANPNYIGFDNYHNSGANTFDERDIILTGTDDDGNDWKAKLSYGYKLKQDEVKQFGLEDDAPGEYVTNSNKGKRPILLDIFYEDIRIEERNIKDILLKHLNDKPIGYSYSHYIRVDLIQGFKSVTIKNKIHVDQAFIDCCKKVYEKTHDIFKYGKETDLYPAIVNHILTHEDLEDFRFIHKLDRDKPWIKNENYYVNSEHVRGIKPDVWFDQNEDDDIPSTLIEVKPGEADHNVPLQSFGQYTEYVDVYPNRAKPMLVIIAEKFSDNAIKMIASIKKQHDIKIRTYRGSQLFDFWHVLNK